MRGATRAGFLIGRGCLISIHAPHAGSDHYLAVHFSSSSGFQSTPPMRGATCKIMCAVIYQAIFQSTPPMRGATLFWFTWRVAIFHISIHAPHAGSDLFQRLVKPMIVVFQSTPPMRGATLSFLRAGVQGYISIHAPHAGSDRLRQFGVFLIQISIHAPHAGSDFPWTKITPFRYYFNPRPPCGERLFPSGFPSAPFLFQSTPPMRGATPDVKVVKTWFTFQSTPPMRGATIPPVDLPISSYISIHAPHAGSDWNPKYKQNRFSTFQSTPPMRGATLDLFLRNAIQHISIHAPHAGSDVHFGDVYSVHCNFNPRPPCGERLRDGV
ncbi:hypothetical protein Pelsub_P2279 [Pelolinea submarina]|nr:hypothetical protein Pelsub_P2279 [Pelolinea submarina]